MRKNNRGAVYEQMQEEPQSCLRRDFPLSDATFVAAFSNFIVTGGDARGRYRSRTPSYS